MKTPDKIVLEHTGALGDFLLAWPVFLSVTRHFPNVPVHHAVRPAHAPWLAPLAAPCPPDIRRGLEARFAGDIWPPALRGTLVVRPGLAVRPDIAHCDEFLFLQGVVPGRGDNPRALYKEALAGRGIPFADDYRRTFQSFFGSHAPHGQNALLFPGAGHPDKAWPMGRLEILAELLRRHDVRPVFVLGPAEQERKVAPAHGDTLRPRDLASLSAAIRAARFVVGPDCGPLHLAGMLGVPGIAVFGPTSPAQWGPDGLTIATANLPCSPCTAVTSGDFAADCPRPLPCLAAISPEAILARLTDLNAIPGLPQRLEVDRPRSEQP